MDICRIGFCSSNHISLVDDTKAYISIHLNKHPSLFGVLEDWSIRRIPFYRRLVII